MSSRGWLLYNNSGVNVPDHLCTIKSWGKNHHDKLKILNSILPPQLQKLNSGGQLYNILTINNLFMNIQYLKVQIFWFVLHDFYCKINKYSNQLSNISSYYLNIIFKFIISTDVLIKARKCGSRVQRL